MPCLITNVLSGTIRSQLYECFICIISFDSVDFTQIIKQSLKIEKFSKDFSQGNAVSSCLGQNSNPSLNWYFF